MRVSETDGDGNGIAALLQSFDDSSSNIKGVLEMRHDTNPAIWRAFSVTGAITDSGAWDVISLSSIAGSGTFLNNDPVKIRFSRTGDKGDTGATGAAGADLTGQWHLLERALSGCLPLDAAAASIFIPCSNFGGLWVPSNFNAYTHGVQSFWIHPADFVAVSGKTLKLRVRGWAVTNGTDPNTDLAFSLRAVTPSGGSDALAQTPAGVVVTGSSVTMTNANLGTNDTESIAGASFNCPSAGLYILSVSNGSLLANNAVVQVGARLEYRWE